ncbi:alpha/beta hydrolase family protein [Solicola sp. PLA-1-18]|uniref:alpha/beta hydrolase family protein n=1 Tax=Solicola sp. PLA-1-18 TaxID=3380532 RepID=UPI003B7FE1DD
MLTRRRLLAVTVPLAATAVVGCSGSSDAPTPSPSTTTPPPTTPSASPSPSPTASAPPPNPVSVPALKTREYDGGDLRLGRVLDRDDAYVRYAATFRGDGLRISGVMNVPRGAGPFPVLILNHGYIDPAVYRTGQGMMREQDYLAREGYAVLHVDYRNHAGSDDDPDVDVELRLPYSVDVVNAALAVRDSDVAELDGARMGYFGRSMGGPVTYNALIARPDLVKAAVVYAPTSSVAIDNVRQFYLDDGGRDEAVAELWRRYGRPDTNPTFWREASSRPYLGDIAQPLLVQQGEQDDTCPPRWARATVEAMKAAGGDVELVTYEREGHTFYDQFARSMRRTTRFFDRHLV